MIGAWPASWRIVIEGTREDWPGGARTLTPRYPTREPNGTFWFGAELPAGDQVWFRIAEEAIGRMPEKTPRDRGARLVDALIVWITPDRQLTPGLNRGEPVRTVAGARTPPKDRRPRPKQWTDAVAVLRRLQGEYEAWRDGLPEPLANSRTAELLEGVYDVDLDALDVKLPRGFGRD